VHVDGVGVDAPDLASLALYNYGHFTSMRVEDMAVRGLGLHLARLVADSGHLFGHAIDPDRVRDLVRRAVPAHGGPVVVRVTVFAPDFDLSRPGRDVRPKILVTQRPAPPTAQPPLRVRTCRFDRDLPGVKHTGLFGQLHERRSAQLDGYDDALFVGTGAVISEGPTWNIGFIRSGRVIWPESTCLPGVTMRLIRAALAAAGVATRAVPVGVSTVADMDAAFATNAATGVRAISHIDDLDLGRDGGLLARIGSAYWATDAEAL
jgi:branched-subunit amino acid aminotransferase/4-amino-4-deoxychorismate lyase